MYSKLNKIVNNSTDRNALVKRNLPSKKILNDIFVVSLNNIGSLFLENTKIIENFKNIEKQKKLKRMKKYAKKEISVQTMTESKLNNLTR